MVYCIFTGDEEEETPSDKDTKLKCNCCHWKGELDDRRGWLYLIPMQLCFLHLTIASQRGVLLAFYQSEAVK